MEGLYCVVTFRPSEKTLIYSPARRPILDWSRRGPRSIRVSSNFQSEHKANLAINNPEIRIELSNAVFTME